MKNPRALAYAAFAVVCIVWGTTYLAIRVAVETVPPLFLIGTRFLIAGVVMFGVASLRGERLPRNPRLLGYLALAGILLVAVGNLAVVWAEQWVPSGLASLLVATAPFWAALLERMRGQRTSRRAVIGMMVGFAGVALLVTPQGAGGHFDMHFVLGALAIQLGSIAWQLGTMIGKYRTKEVPPLMSAALQMFSGGLVGAIASVATGELHRVTFTRATAGALIYLTIFGSILAYTAYIYALAHMPTTKMSLYAYVNPIVAVVLGWLILNESLTWASIVAMCVILVGVALVQTAGYRRKPTFMDVRYEHRDAA